VDRSARWAWTWKVTNEGNTAAVEDIPLKKAEKPTTSQGCKSQKSWEVGQGEQVSVPGVSVMGGEVVTGGKKGRRGFLEMFLGLQLRWGPPEEKPASYFSSREGKGEDGEAGTRRRWHRKCSSWKTED